MLPEVWLNGLQLTGFASDTSPVLAGCEIEWGASSDIEHQDAATLTIQILFRTGTQDITGLQRGAEIELTYDGVTVFAGSVRSATAISHTKGLLATVNCVEHLADLQGLYTSTEWLFETSAVRWLTLKDLFAGRGFDLQPRALSTGQQEARAYYSSIKVITLLERFLASNGRLTRWDASERVDGELVKTVKAGLRGTSSGANRLDTDRGIWIVQYTTSTSTGVITWLDASNVVQSGWTLEPGTAINSVNFSYPVTEQDPDTLEYSTSLKEAVRNDTAAQAVYGINAADVTISSHGEDIAQTLDEVAQTWYRPDSGWTLESVPIYDSTELTRERLQRLLDNKRRSQNLVIVRGILGNAPADTASNVRASLIGGTYIWDGEQWDITLRLGRNQDFTAANQWTFADIAAASDPAISLGTANSIGDQITFADFRQISKD